MATERRVKSKMKKSDPENFTIHDFLGECKTTDAADSRFDDEAADTARFFVLGAPTAKLGNLYNELAKRIAERTGWVQKNDDRGRFHLILGGPRGSGIPFKRFAQLFKWDYGIVPHCNCFRGHVWLTQKAKLIQTLRQAKLEHLAPQSFLYFPSSAEDSELDELRAASESTQKRASTSITWIAKASDASRGERTLISDDFGHIQEHLEGQDKTSAAWVVQRYVADPLLLPGGRKFDLRFFVLADSELNFYVCSQAAIKVCSSPFSIEDLSDRVAHLSVAAVQRGASRDDFPIEQFSKWLASEHNASFDETIVQPAHAAIAQVLEAARTKLENVDHADFTSFQVFAFDFLVDAQLKPWFIEVCAPTDFPADLAADMATDVFELAVEPVFSEGGRAQSAACGALFQPLDLACPPSNNGIAEGSAASTKRSKSKK